MTKRRPRSQLGKYLLLPGDALRVEEWRGHISKASKQNVLETDWNIYGGIYRRHVGKIS